ncbi:hypothetical protein [Reichenbachiella ulvae]|uniref:Lipoprotein n=1 Tax=Reichenbachiella ulvae TaxID=2980104 RepID=A0ABT3CSI9_9BACT|nr:hypothetical protein [Reichenbachiella ulvae]MCV9386218.1 hypothetical protein [Reichenbachiella ulvae]
MKRLIAWVLIPLVMLSACSEEGDGDLQGAEPVLPPTSSMAPEFGSFSSSSESGRQAAVISNWGYAAVNVAVYSSILYQHLVVPVTAFKATVGTQAQFDVESGLWIWERSFNVPNKGEYQVKLTASVDGTDVSWIGYISLGSTIEEFVWFDGASQLDGSAGSWTLYESPENPSAWLSSEWSRIDDSEQANVTFTVEKEGDNLGSSVSYSVDLNADLDRSVMITDVSASNEIYVDWNHEAGYGQVKSHAYFQDELYHCWDAQLMDATCE